MIYLPTFCIITIKITAQQGNKLYIETDFLKLQGQSLTVSANPTRQMLLTHGTAVHRRRRRENELCNRIYHGVDNRVYVLSVCLLLGDAMTQPPFKKSMDLHVWLNWKERQAIAEGMVLDGFTEESTFIKWVVFKYLKEAPIQRASRQNSGPQMPQDERSHAEPGVMTTPRPTEKEKRIKHV
jgi:hypothetical protein